ncbi:DNA-binding SARP family transcriptional activator [Kitasatospora sp. MAP12-15]|uniref:AfsR/SARP family transcriptional regulator n=1 Tax=unclassified Kitasatospora TaxID=2633591 RepID=UPI0024733DCE|nr:AfsR/SARP family transcriptional regulator [Kitasatospora sp. MAP12-44]MDH6114418.1 DNA-binding SARP family transcriptional activator [Kitasatospora sp. MAP12-44]
MQLGILGPLSACEDGRAVVVTGERQRNLLAALLVRAGATVSCEALTQAVWDCRAPAGARGALHTGLSRLRNQLGPSIGARIVTRSPGYHFEVGPHELDLHRFEAAARDGRAALARGDWAQAYRLLSEADGLWRGEPLEDVPSTALHEAWSEPLRQRRLAVRLDRADAGLHLGRQAELLPRLDQLTREHPLDERVHERLMLALHLDNRTPEALAAFRQARRLLVREVGVEPGPALQRLHNRMLTRAV